MVQEIFRQGGYDQRFYRALKRPSAITRIEPLFHQSIDDMLAPRKHDLKTRQSIAHLKVPQFLLRNRPNRLRRKRIERHHPIDSVEKIKPIITYLLTILY